MKIIGYNFIHDEQFFCKYLKSFFWVKNTLVSAVLPKFLITPKIMAFEPFWHHF